MNNKTNFKILEIIDSLSESFTDDALFLIQSYFKKLNKKMIESGVPHRKQRFIIDGLQSFLDEYIEDSIGKKRISFDDTLDILSEIGSPTEIIQTLSFTKHTGIITTSTEENHILNKHITSNSNIDSSEIFQRENNLNFCRYCRTANEKSSNYCVNCGKNLFTQENFSQNLRQDLIDHNYLITFILCWICFAAVNVLIYISFDTTIFALLFPDIHLRKWGISFPEDLVISMVLSFIPALLTAFIGGYILDELYFAKLKSQKQRYRQAIENLHDRFFIGIWLVVIAVFIFVFLSLNGFVEFMVTLMLSILIYVGSFWKQFLGSDQPHNLPYFKLLSAKKSLDNHVKDKYFLFNPISIFISVILAAVWTILGDSFFHQEFDIQQLLLVGGLAMIALFVLFNGFFFIYFYDWSYIMRFIRYDMERNNFAAFSD